jgi:hypothetical protein
MSMAKKTSIGEHWHGVLLAEKTRAGMLGWRLRGLTIVVWLEL